MFAVSTQEKPTACMSDLPAGVQAGQPGVSTAEVKQLKVELAKSKQVAGQRGEEIKTLTKKLNAARNADTQKSRQAQQAQAQLHEAKSNETKYAQEMKSQGTLSSKCSSTPAIFLAIQLYAHSKLWGNQDSFLGCA